MSSYFGNASRVDIAGARFVFAEEALDAEYVRGNARLSREWGEKPTPEPPGTDWPGTFLLMLTLLQLTETIRLIEELLGVSEEDLAQLDVVKRYLDVRSSLGIIDDLESDSGTQVLYHADELAETVSLWLALRSQADTKIGLAWEYGRELTLVCGPVLPECPLLGVRGGDGVDLNDDPARLFEIAATMTRTVASSITRLANERETAERVRQEHEPVAPWLLAGFDAADFESWHDVTRLYLPGSAVEDEHMATAIRWSIAGFDAESAKGWTMLLVEDGQIPDELPVLARAWKTKFGLSEATWWLRTAWVPGVDAAIASRFDEAGWHATDVWALSLFLGRERPVTASADFLGWSELPKEHALACARAGMTLADAVLCMNVDAADLQALWQGQFDDAPRIDPGLAIDFNEWCAPSEYEDGGDNIAWWRTRLWDRHDESNVLTITEAGEDPGQFTFGARPLSAGPFQEEGAR